MSSTTLDAPVSPPAAGERGPELDTFAGDAARLVLTGHPRGGAPAPGQAGLAFRPKEIVMALAAALAEAEGLDVSCANPHFTPLADWGEGLAVAHFCGIDACCPLPLARNTLLLDGEDLLALAEERRSEGAFGLHRRRASLMDALLGAVPPALAAATVLDCPLPGAPIDGLLRRAAPLLAGQERRRPGLSTRPSAGLPRPVQWLACDLETGHYNFLELKRRPRLGTSHARVLLDPGLREGAGALVAFATPATLGELGPALRAFAALRAGEEGKAGPLLFVFFFGSAEEFTSTLAARPDALFFGDNFRCPAIRFLFAPFAPADVLAAIQGASAVIDTAYGGVLDQLARGLGVADRLLLGAGGDVEAHRGGAVVARGIAWDAALEPSMLARRRHKADRRGERALAEILETML